MNENDGNGMKTIKISVDLMKAASRQLEFLKFIDSSQYLLDETRVLQAIRRYETVWLPLVAKQPDLGLVPPLDVHWIWHCHMLAPYFYQEDCMRLVNTVVDHAPIKDTRYKRAIEKTKQLWEKEYPQEPFQLQILKDYTQKSRYDLKAAVSRQSSFYYQVSLPHYHTKRFLKFALHRYELFLQLKKSYPNVFIVPCYDIDLIWHTHQLHPVAYNNDTANYLGRMLNHDDTVTDRSPGSEFVLSCEATKQLWCDAFKKKYASRGCMYRGMSFRGHLNDLTIDELFAISCKEANVTISHATLECYDNSLSGNITLRISKSDLHLSPKTIRVVHYTTVKSKWNSPIELGAFNFNTCNNLFLNFQLKMQDGRGCFSSRETYSHLNFPMAQIINYTSSSGGTHEHRIDLDPAGNADSPCLLTFSTKIQPLNRERCVLHVTKSNFSTCVSHQAQPRLWEPIPFDHINMKIPEYKTIYADHCLFRNLENNQLLMARVLHCPEKAFSGVLVSNGGRILAIANEIGSEQLPAAKDPAHPSVDRRLGERAMIIQDNNGDWCILIGLWVDFCVGRPGTPYAQGRRGNQGHMIVRWHDLRNGSSQSLVLKTNRFEYSIGFLTGNLITGRLQIENDDIGQNIALAFSLAVLHVLCQPRPLDGNGRTRVSHEPMFNGKKEIQCIGYEKCVMLLAAGYTEVTPCNCYIKTHLTSSGVACQAASGCGGCGGGELATRGAGTPDGIESVNV